MLNHARYDQALQVRLSEVSQPPIELMERKENDELRANGKKSGEKKKRSKIGRHVEVKSDLVGSPKAERQRAGVNQREHNRADGAMLLSEFQDPSNN